MQSIEKRVDDLFSLWCEANGAGGQLVVVHKGETILERCYCYANIEKKRPMTQDSVFRVASVSKQITAMSIMMLHDQGVLNIDDDIHKYLPDIASFPEKVTISQMLHHTSGIRERGELAYLAQKEGSVYPDQKGALKLISQQKNLSFTPGDEFVYCNSTYVMLATVVERLTGMTLNEFAKKNIFEPLGMTSTYFQLDPQLPEERRVLSYHDDGYQYIPCPAVSQIYGCSGLRSTCRDMVKFMPQYKNPTLVSRETMEKVYLNIPPISNGTVTNYACGVRINELEGHRYYHHGGVLAGFRTFTVIFPDDDLVIAVFTNTYNIPIEVAGRDIARIVLGLPERKRNNLDAYKTEGVDLNTVAGGYIHETTGMIYEIALLDGVPYVRFNEALVKLEPVGGNLYKMGRRNITFAFGDKPAVNHEEAVRPLRKLPDAVPETAVDYVGHYYCQEVDSTFDVALRDGILWLEHPQQPPQRMYDLGGENFCYGSIRNKRQTRFVRENGTVTQFVHNTLQTRGMVFVKE